MIRKCQHCGSRFFFGPTLRGRRDEAAFCGLCTWALRQRFPDPIDSPAHYKVGGIESNDILRAKLPPEMYEGKLLGSAIEYLMRAPHKGKYLEDLKKAQRNLDWLIELVEGRPGGQRPGGGEKP